MTLSKRVLKAYRAEAQRTGSYLTARAYVMRRFGLSAARADRILATAGRG